jgi:hypothetical protein
MSSTEYPCASYFWIGDVVSTADALLLFGIARERWMARSVEPVRIYVPGPPEKVTAFTGPATWIRMGKLKGAVRAAYHYVS